MSFLQYLGPFLLLLGILVVVHELGHFIVAKLFGVKVERFAVGFGPPLLRRSIGETEYVLAWLPLGGYVKMLGESPDEELSDADRARSFNGQSPLRRIAIATAGPAMNLVLSVVVIAGLLITTGWPTATSRIGSVRPDSPAAKAGLLAGDRVVGIEGREIWRWSELTEAVRQSSEGLLSLEVERGQERLQLGVVPEVSPDGQGLLIGVEHHTALALIGLPDPTAVLAQAGLRTGDRVVMLNDQEVADWYRFESLLASTTGGLELEVARQLAGDEERIRVNLPAPDERRWSIESLGVVVVDFAVLEVQPASPARRAKVAAGDILLSMGGETVQSFAQVAERVRESDGSALELLVLRDGAELAIEVLPERRIRERDGVREPTWVIGILGGAPRGPGERRDDVIRNPFTATWQGVVRTGEVFLLTTDAFAQLITRKVGVENLAGPIGIGEIAGESFAAEGWFSFLWILCVISVNLAILNLLPIPILDGGHILFAIVESVRGGPIGVRAREIGQTLGLSLIVLLMGFAFWNDISRHWMGIIGFFKGLL